MYNTWIFNCQHGPLECWGNKIQACALAQNSSKDMEFVNCFMSVHPSEHSLFKCSQLAGMDYPEIKRCVNSEVGSELLVRYGDITNRILPPVKYVPSIVLNGKYDANFDTNARRNLLRTLSEVYLQKQNMIQENVVPIDHRFLVINKNYRLPSHFYDIYGALQKTMYHNGFVNN
ncbi:hypothetical protein ILUMI_16909 [Ignelater luminosus]|uniref:Uncharacterized protein n=1 Tax=Ignelater luminosus TaxID=2038154 RepID=A0A8K0CMP8_IGNLU|nr:hypothetical protein ILUMI_16909 [Ignelater luminosus]